MYCTSLLTHPLIRQFIYTAKQTHGSESSYTYLFIHFYLYLFTHLWSRISVVHMLTRLRARRFGVLVTERLWDFLSPNTSRPTLGSTQPHVKLVPVFSVGGKAVEAWCWPLTFILSAEVKNEWSYTTAPPMCIHSVVRNSFTFYYIYIYICLRSMNFLKNHFQLNLCSVKSLNVYCLIKFARMWKEIIVD